MRIYKSTSKRTGITYKSIHPFDVNKNEDFAQTLCTLIGVIAFIAFIIKVF